MARVNWGLTGLLCQVLFVSAHAVSLKQHPVDFSQDDLFLSLADDVPPSMEWMLSEGDKNSLDFTKASTRCSLEFVMLLDSVSRIRNGTMNDFDAKIGLLSLDASGKEPPGVLKGNFVYAGAFHQCRRLKYSLTTSTYKAGFCRVYMSNSIGIDVCVPKSCTGDELTGLFKALAPQYPITTVSCAYELGRKQDWKTWVIVVVMVVIGAVCAFATVYDYFFSQMYSTLSELLPMRLLLAFSFYSNVSELFISGGSKRVGQIGPMHFMRFLSVSWIIVAYTLEINFSLSGNPVDIIAATKNTISEVTNNAYLAFDSLFFLSGLLLAFTWFRDYEKHPKRAMSPISWITFYVHRIVRVSPPYYMMILFYAFVVTTWRKDMAIYMNPQTPKQDDVCEQNWWINLLYLNNFIHYKNQCYPISWYLATEMQIYLFTPLLLVPLAIRPLYGFIVSGLVLVLSTAINIFTVYHNYFPPSPFSVPGTDLGYQDPRMSDYQKYTVYIYGAPWIRCQIYILGMLVGYYLQTNRRPPRIDWVSTFASRDIEIFQMLNVLLWCLSAAMMLAVLLGLHSWTNNHAIPLFWRSIYSAFSKLAWGIGLAWIVIACFYNYGGPINKFMSWNIWVPVGRLAYCAYLNQIWVVFLMIGLKDTTIYWSGFVDMWIQSLCPAIVLSFFFSIIWSSAFEIPFIKVETVLYENVRRRPTLVKPTNNDTEVMPVIVNNGLIDENTDEHKRKIQNFS